MRKPALKAIGLAGGLLAGCATGPQLAQLRQTAASDLDCPGTQVRLRMLERFESEAVSGCDHKATYELRDGAWVMTSRDGVSAEGALPPPPGDHEGAPGGREAR